MDKSPDQKTKPRIAYAERRVKPLARLLRCATALRVTAPLGCGSRRLVWPKGSFRPVHGPKPSSAPPRTNFLHKAVGKGLGPLEF